MKLCNLLFAWIVYGIESYYFHFYFNIKTIYPYEKTHIA